MIDAAFEIGRIALQMQHFLPLSGGNDPGIVAHAF